MCENMIYDYIIIGSGIGGATIFNQLAKKYPNKKILLLEKGNNPKYILEGKNTQIIYVNGLGGSGIYAVGNGIKIDLTSIINISSYEQKEIYNTIEKELKINIVPKKYIDTTSLNILDNYNYNLTPKYIDFFKCTLCGDCASVLCSAKWTPLNYIKEIKLNNKYNNTKIITNCNVLSIEKNNEYYIINTIKNNIEKTIMGKNIFLCAGGINTPRILKTASNNEEIGKNLFVDLFITVGGYLKNVNLKNSVPMSIHKKYGNNILIANHYSKLLLDQYKKRNLGISEKDIYGMMIKIKDENNGVVENNNSYKELTEKDKELLNRGEDIVKDILINNNIKEDSIISTMIRGSHPSGTCAIGKVVNKNLEVEDLPNLYVCDSSIFPESLGVPPILGIIAISKNLVNNL